MKIVDLTTFRTMPSGTVFQKFTSDKCLESPQILRSLAGPDFVTTDLFSDDMLGDEVLEIERRFTAMHEDGASHPLGFEICGRDGMFDPEQLFAVWSADDVSALIAVLGEALARQSGTTI